MGVPDQRWIEIVGPGQSGVLPAVPHALAAVSAVGVVDHVAFHTVKYVVNVLVTGLGQHVNCHGATPAGAAHGQDGVIRIQELLHIGQKIIVGLDIKDDVARLPQ